MMLSVKTYASDRVIYTIKEVSMNNEIESKVNQTAVADKFKITLKYANNAEGNLRITSYNKVDENTLEIYYEENCIYCSGTRYDAFLHRSFFLLYIIFRFLQFSLSLIKFLFCNVSICFLSI